MGWFCDSKPIVEADSRVLTADFVAGSMVRGQKFGFWAELSLAGGRLFLKNGYFSVGFGAFGVKPSEMACWRICSTFSGQLMGSCLD